MLLSYCSVDEDRGVTAALQSCFLDESLTTDATEFRQLRNKSHSSISSYTSSTIKMKVSRIVF